MQTINPYKLFTGAFIPNWLLERKEVSAQSKLCYARLCQYAGKNGECYPKQTELAEQLGVSRRQIEHYIQELKKCKLIDSIRVGKCCANRYVFLWHEWMDIPETSHQPPVQNNSSAPFNPATPIERESIERESSTMCKEVLDTIINHYIKAKKWEKTIEKNKKLLSDIYKRNGRSAKLLVSLAGELSEAIAAIDYIAESSKKGGWDWTLDTVCKKFVEYKSSVTDKPEGAAGREL